MNREFKPTVPQIAPFVHALYEEHAAGCCLHIVLDDGNVADSSVEFCIDYSVRNGCPPWHAALARALRSMSQTQRLKVKHSPQAPLPCEVEWYSHLGDYGQYDPDGMLLAMSLHGQEAAIARWDTATKEKGQP